MNTIQVQTGRPYPIIIGSGLLSQFPSLFAQVYQDRKPHLAIITDDQVNALYADTLIASLTQAGYSTCKFVFPNGEASKNLSVLEQVYGFLSENEITRTDVILALGGGVVGDLAGYAAASWLRGIDFVQIPTTLLAMVDSSVGGKTAVDIPQGKNLVGAFWQPTLVVCDTDALKTLPAKTYTDGMAEVIKYGAILDKELFMLLEQGEMQARQNEIIARCIDLKRQVVEQDERDTGLRQILNFGHTFGHAIEKISQFSITHGQGVSIGMVLIAHACESAKITPEGTAQRIESCCAGYHLPVKTDLSIAELCRHALGDKKRAGSRITLITLEEIGNAQLSPIAVEKLCNFMEGAHG